MLQKKVNDIIPNNSEVGRAPVVIIHSLVNRPLYPKQPLPADQFRQGQEFSKLRQPEGLALWKLG